MREKIILALIIILGFTFRFYGINFDDTCCQHPDERAIVMYTLPLSLPQNFNQFLSTESPMNPHFFAYGNMPLYLLKSTALLASKIDPIFLTYDKIDLVGRMISIFSDLATIGMIFIIGKTLFDKKIAILASFTYSISVLPIQYSHFYTSDVLLTAIVSLTLFRAIKFYKKPNIKNAFLTGISFGLALVTKISATPLVVSLLFSLFADFFFVFIRTPHKPKHWLPHLPLVVRKLLTEGIVMAFSATLTFILFQPYAIIDSSEFIKQNLAQLQMTHDAYVFPYTLQYVGKTPYVYEIKNLFLWGLGPIAATFSLIGLFLIFKSIKKYENSKKAEIIILLIFCFFYFAIIGRSAVGFMRYLLPIYPILALFSAISLAAAFDYFSSFRSKLLQTISIAIVFLLLIIWPLSFISIYSKTNTRIAASTWIHKNIPVGSTLATEHWDDRLPLADSSEYNFEEMTLYDQPDNTMKWDNLSQKLQQSQYIIIASNRLYIPIQKLSDCTKYRVCYPISSKYYKSLFSGKLGFQKIAEFSSTPTIPFVGLKINDISADESFTVYDHPTIMIFKKTNVVNTKSFM
ncbi:MAG TPA: glycosyltransferase family 39 protein [Patescibacteria group bacterium]|nr:glycosyltransferase family 39 protein [Patescibacteria group bacterium]